MVAIRVSIILLAGSRVILHLVSTSGLHVGILVITPSRLSYLASSITSRCRIRMFLLMRIRSLIIILSVGNRQTGGPKHRQPHGGKAKAKLINESLNPSLPELILLSNLERDCVDTTDGGR